MRTLRISFVKMFAHHLKKARKTERMNEIQSYRRKRRTDIKKVGARMNEWMDAWMNG